MKCLNITYFAEYDSKGNILSYTECDIVCVPNYIADNASGYAQSFLRWLESEDLTDDYYYLNGNHKYIICDTHGFIKWLNNYITLNEKSKIITLNTDYNKEYDTIDF